MIREATQADADALAVMGARFFLEAGIPERFAALGVPNITFCPQSFLLSCEFMSRNGVMLVVEKGGEVVGMLGALFAPAPWNASVKIGHEAWLYVQEGKRDGVGGALVREYEKRAAAQGVVISGMVAEHGLREVAVGRLFKAKGYAPAETVFWKRLNAVTH